MTFAGRPTRVGPMVFEHGHRIGRDGLEIHPTVRVSQLCWLPVDWKTRHEVDARLQRGGRSTRRVFGVRAP